MKDPFRFLLTGLFGITFDRITEICLSVFDKPVHCTASLMYGIRRERERVRLAGLIESSSGIRIYEVPCM